MNKKTYSEKLRDPRWQKRRLDVLNRSDFTCEDCGATDMTLHVHHCLYCPNREPWEYEDAELRSVCVNCHEERAKIEKRAVLDFKLLLARMTWLQIDDLGVQMSMCNDYLTSPEGRGDTAAIVPSHVLE